MTPPSSMIDAAAFAIFKTFIRNAQGTLRMKRDRLGQPVGAETPDEAAERRWRDMPEVSRNRFRDEATAVLSAV